MKHFSVGSRSRSRALIYVLAWVCLGICARTANAAVWYVDKDNTSGVEDGRSWETAYRTIQPAIDAAHAVGGGDVWVAEGIYDEVRTAIWNYEESGSLVVFNKVNLYGGFVGNETTLLQSDPDKHKTTISGARCINGQGAHVIIHSMGESIIHGISLTGVSYNGWSIGIYPEGNISISKCNFSKMTLNYGACIYASKRVNVSIDNCQFNDNKSCGSAAISLMTFRMCSIHSCVFANNHISPEAISSGGGVLFISINTPVYISDCIFANNTAFSKGIGKFSSANVNNVIFLGNRAIMNNEGVGRMENASNCIFWGNRAAGHGGAVGLDGVIDCGIDDTPCDCVSLRTLSNCTFAKNRAGIAGGAVWANAANIWNCILWDDEPNEIAPWDEAQNYVNYSLIEGGMPSGMQTLNTCLGPFCNNTLYYSFPTDLGILDQDPKFVTGPSGTCTGLTHDAEAVQSVLTDSGASFTPGAWKGAYLGIGTGANEYWYYIIDNDATTLRVWADATEGGTVSAPIVYEVMTHRLAPDSPCIDAGANTTIECYGGVTTDIEGKQRGLDGDGVDNALAGDGSGYDIGAWEYPETGCGYGLMFGREYAALVKALPDLIGAEGAAQLNADPATLDFENGAAWLAWVNGGSVGLEPALGDGVPDLWQLRLMAETFCAAPDKSGQDAWLDDAAAFRDTYLTNRELWVTKIESLLRTSMPAANRSNLEYVRRETSRVYPALLSISGATRDAYLALLTGLGVTGNYTPITWPGKTVLEPFSGAGDLDYDGRDNATEYDDVISAGGDVDDYIQQAGYNDPFWPGNPAIPIDPWTLTALTLSLAICATRRLGQRR